jgi:hypothetical protein
LLRLAHSLESGGSWANREDTKHVVAAGGGVVVGNDGRSVDAHAAARR